VASRAALIVGHSHTVCLGVPLISATRAPAVVDIPGFPSFQGLTGVWPRDQAYHDRLKEEAVGRKMIFVWRGNQHLAHYLFATRPYFDFFLSSRPDLPVMNNACLVPETAVRSRFAPINERLRWIVTALAAQGSEPVICGTPPPSGDNEAVRRRIETGGRTEAVFQRVASEFGSESMQLSPPMLRLKLWLLMQAMMEEVAAECGVPYVAVPKSVTTEEGYLREEFCEDSSHANATYGYIVLKNLESVLGLGPHGEER